MAVGLGGCHEDGDAPALWPWTQVQRALGIDANVPADADAFGLLDAVTTAIVERGHRGPIVCVLEDAHWADTTTLRLLGFIAVELRDTPVLLVVTVRSDENSDAVGPTIAKLLRHPGAVHVQLGSLSPAGTVQLAQAVVGDRSVSFAGLHGRTGGNPLFVTQLARLIASEGPDAGLPIGVREVISRRLRRLPTEANSVLALAAVAGSESSLELLAAASDVGVDRVADLLDTAVATGVLSVTEASGRLAFVHALVRETVLSSIGDLQRKRLHARLAKAFGQMPHTELNSYARAHHAVQATPLLPPGEVRSACIEAARLAEASSMFDTAAVWWRRAIDAVTAQDRDAEAEHRLLLALAAAHHRAGADDSARVAIDAAFESALAQDRTVDAVDVAAALGDTGGTWLWVRPGEDPTEAFDRLERIAARLEPDDHSGRAKVLGTLALGRAAIMDTDASAVLSAEALEAARRSDDLPALGRALSVRWRSIWGPGGQPEQLAVGHELEDVARRLGDTDLLLSAAVCLHIAHLTLADVPEAQRHLDRVLALTAEHGRPLVEAQILPQVATLALLRGDLDAAERATDIAVQRWAQTEFGVTSSGLGVILRWRIRREQGRAAELSDEIDAVLGQPPVADPRFRAVAAVARGRDDDARQQLVGVPLGHVARWYAATAYAVIDAELIADLALVDVAAVAVEQFEPYAGELASLGTAGCLGPVALALGRMAMVAGRTADAEQAFRRAIEISDRNELRTPSTWARAWLAVLLRGVPSRHAEAVALATEARREAERLGLVAAGAVAASVR